MSDISSRTTDVKAHMHTLNELSCPPCLYRKYYTILQHTYNIYVPNNTHIIYVLSYIPVIVCTIVMAFKKWILTSGLNLQCNTLNTRSIAASIQNITLLLFIHNYYI